MDGYFHNTDTSVNNRVDVPRISEDKVLFVKRVQSVDMASMRRRIDWTTGTVYIRYDDGYSPTNTANSDGIITDCKLLCLNR